MERLFKNCWKTKNGINRGQSRALIAHKRKPRRAFHHQSVILTKKPRMQRHLRRCFFFFLEGAVRSRVLLLNLRHPHPPEDLARIETKTSRGMKLLVTTGRSDVTADPSFAARITLKATI